MLPSLCCPRSLRRTGMRTGWSSPQAPPLAPTARSPLQVAGGSPHPPLHSWMSMAARCAGRRTARHNWHHASPVSRAPPQPDRWARLGEAGGLSACLLVGLHTYPHAACARPPLLWLGCVAGDCVRVRACRRPSQGAHRLTAMGSGDGCPKVVCLLKYAAPATLLETCTAFKTPALLCLLKQVDKLEFSKQPGGGGARQL